MRNSVFVAAILSLAAAAGSTSALAQEEKPTVVLVHGAFAGSSSWNGVAARLQNDGYPVIAVANPLRGVKFDADYVRRVVSNLKTPVVLVGHSYGGPVISEAAAGVPNVKSLVYVSAFAPDPGETALQLTGKFPGSTLGEALGDPVPQADGSKDLYISQQKFPAQFAADVPLKQARIMAATQRPVDEAALGEAATDPAWKTIPSWHIYGSADKNIPPAAMHWMAERAKAQKEVIVKGASHVVMVSHPGAVARLIEDAASAK